MCQQPVIYQYVCYPPPTKKELYFLNKVIGIEGGGVRNFVFFFVTDMLEINSFGCQSKGSLNRLILGIWVFVFAI